MNKQWIELGSAESFAFFNSSPDAQCEVACYRGDDYEDVVTAEKDGAIYTTGSRMDGYMQVMDCAEGMRTGAECLLHLPNIKVIFREVA